MSIGEIIRYHHKKNHYTQADLVGIMTKYGAISAWENNASVPNANQFIILCQILDIDNWRI